jgi:hypothetical protein
VVFCRTVEWLQQSVAVEQRFRHTTAFPFTSTLSRKARNHRQLRDPAEILLHIAASGLL